MMTAHISITLHPTSLCKVRKVNFFLKSWTKSQAEQLQIFIFFFNLRYCWAKNPNLHPSSYSALPRPLQKKTPPHKKKNHPPDQVDDDRREDHCRAGGVECGSEPPAASLQRQERRGCAVHLGAELRHQPALRPEGPDGHQPAQGVRQVGEHGRAGEALQPLQLAGGRAVEVLQPPTYQQKM